MPQVATPSLVEVACQVSGGAGSGPHYNIYHFKVLTTAATAASGAVSALTTFYNSIKINYGTTTSVSVGYRVLDRSAVPWTFLAPTPTTTVGTGSLTNAPAQLAMTISWRTAAVGRSYRGRTFLGPLNNQSLNAAVWSVTSVNGVQTAANALVATSTASSDYKLCVFSHKHNTLEPVISAGVTTAIRTLRSRA